MTDRHADPRPFHTAPRAALVLPAVRDDHPKRGHVDMLATLILRELAEMAAELGCPVVPSAPDALGDHTPAMLIGPAAMNPALQHWRERQTARTLPHGPYVAVDRERARVVVDAPDLDGVGEAMQLLRTAIAEGQALLEPSLCDSASDVLDRLDAEVRRTFPLLDERAPGWADAVARMNREMRNPDDLPMLQRLMATLGDAHSWAKDARINGRLPYHLYDHGGITVFWDVPEGTVAWEQGIRAGDMLQKPSIHSWRYRTGSVERAKPWNAGYRMLQGRVGEMVELTALRRNGAEIRWSEPVPALPWLAPIETNRLDANTGYLRIRGWLNGSGWRDAFEGALQEMARYDRLVVDLRGNAGGALVAAQDARARFLPGRTTLGTIRFSTVTGELAPPHELLAEPPESGPRWEKPVRFLVDPLCYSATEDFLQGLQRLPHVQLVGQQTGGGSGRPRTIWLREHLFATISTALTYDRSGRCIEGNGFLPDLDVPVTPSQPDLAVDLAMES